MSAPHYSTPKPQSQYVNVTVDVLESGVLPLLTGRLREVLLILAGMARTDTASHRYRTAYMYHSWLAEKIGVKRQTATGYLRQLVKLGIIADMGNYKPRVSRKGQQPAILYRIAEANELSEIIYQLEKRERKTFDPEALKRVDNSREGVETVRHLVDERVSNGSDTFMSNGSDIYPKRVSNGSDTKREVKILEREVGKGLSFSPSGNGDNFVNGNGNDNDNGGDLEDAEFEQQKQDVKERLLSILNAAEQEAGKSDFYFEREKVERLRTRVFAQINTGETARQKHEIALECVEQLEFHFADIVDGQREGSDEQTEPVKDS